MAKKRGLVHCAVSWCVCLAREGSPYCAVHAVKGKDYKPQRFTSDITAASIARSRFPYLDAAYLGWAFDTGWHPPVLIARPWEVGA